MNWLLNHWWIATATPYFLANWYFAAQVYPAALDDDPGDAMWRWIFRAIGTWLIVFFAIAYALDGLSNYLNRFGYPLPSRPKVITALREIGWAGVRGAIAGSVLMLLYAGITSTTSHVPSRVEIAVTLLLIGVTAGAVARGRR